MTTDILFFRILGGVIAFVLVSLPGTFSVQFVIFSDWLAEKIGLLPLNSHTLGELGFEGQVVNRKGL